MLLFEFFPGAVAIVVLIVGIVLFVINQRASNNPHEQETPRTPSQPPVSPDDVESEDTTTSRRPSMRA